MDAKRSPGTEISLPDNVVHLLLTVSNSSMLDQALECLIRTAKSADGRSELSSKDVVPAVVQLCKSLSCPSDRHLILLSLKLLRNLCAGEIMNQNSFLEEGGVGMTFGLVFNARVCPPFDFEIIRMGLQLLGNVVLAGVKHQHVVWNEFFIHEFHEIAKIQTSEICDPLCMVLYMICNGTDGLQEELCSDKGILIVIEILKTATVDGFKEDWLKLLFSRICLDGSQFIPIFSKLYSVSVGIKVNNFSAEQAFLLSVLSEALSERMKDFTVDSKFALSILQILRAAHQIVDYSIRGNLSLPTSNSVVDVVGYSLLILRDICARDYLIEHKESSMDVVDALLSDGLINLLIELLQDLEPPALVRKAMNQGNLREGITSQSYKCCPYKGFRRDIVSILGNCAYNRKRAQDEIREKKGIVLLLQHAVADEDNPFLREWGIWSVRNILENNAENQKIVADLELQGSIDS
ncbi:hypothetical protein Leryth_025844 [Lithospermum erythrorhizon]|nr:hypothetical protein Leryth_025844 [Lithospermum erythrorhizon]